MAPAADCSNGDPKPPMAAISSITNPVSTDKYLAYFNDADNMIGVAQQVKTDLGPPLYDFSSAGAKNVPVGAIANPSTMTCVLFQSQINVYGVLNGVTKGDLLVCRLSPGFQLLNVKNPPLATTSSIAACSDGNNNGTLFYLTQDSDDVYQINWIALPGVKSSPKPTNITININPKTYLGAAYGSLGKLPSDSYVGLQNIRSEVYVCSRLNSLSAPITQAKGMKNTPIALTFVGDMLVVYFFGAVGSGVDPDASPIYRAATGDMSRFSFVQLTNAPSPNGYTQLSIIATPSGGGSESVILTYVQKDSEQLVSWEDDLSKFREMDATPKARRQGA